MTYSLLNLCFFAGLAILLLLRKRKIHRRAILISLLLVVGLTAVFDPIMIAVGLVAYDPTKLLGLYWFGAPVEDVAYAVFAVPFVAAMWHIWGARHAR